MFRLNPLAEFLVCSRSPFPSSLKCREQTLIKQFGSHDPLTLSVGRGTHPWDVADGDVKQKFVTFPLDVPQRLLEDMKRLYPSAYNTQIIIEQRIFKFL